MLFRKKAVWLQQQTTHITEWRREGTQPEAESKGYVKRCQGRGRSPTAAHGCGPLREGVRQAVFPPLCSSTPPPTQVHSPHPEKEPETRRHHVRDKGREAGRETERLGETGRDKRTVSYQTKRPAEVAKEGLAWPLGETRQTGPAGARRGRPAGRGGGSPAAPGPLSRPLHEPHFTPRRPRPRLCGAGNTPCRPDRTCSFLAASSLPGAHQPPQKPPPAPPSARVPTTGRRWPQLERAPQARARRGRGRGPEDGAPKPGRRGAPIARAPEQCGHRGAWRGLRSDGG